MTEKKMRVARNQFHFWAVMALFMCLATAQTAVWAAHGADYDDAVAMEALMDTALDDADTQIWSSLHTSHAAGAVTMIERGDDCHDAGDMSMAEFTLFWNTPKRPNLVSLMDDADDEKTAFLTDYDAGVASEFLGDMEFTMGNYDAAYHDFDDARIDYDNAFDHGVDWKTELDAAGAILTSTDSWLNNIGCDSEY